MVVVTRLGADQYRIKRGLGNFVNTLDGQIGGFDERFQIDLTVLDLDPAYAVAEFVIASHRGEVAAGMARETPRRPLFRRLALFLILTGLGLLVFLWLSGQQS